jgi:deoxycytidine triphosphate deaminase
VPDSVLSDGTIRRLVEAGAIVIKPWNPELVQPASIDLRLGDTFRVFHNHRAPVIDLREGPPAGLTEEVVASPEDGFVIHPGEFCLGRTEEWVELPDDVVARIEGKALALDTPVPTPDGWTTMGEIRAGDHVFGPEGLPLRVIGATGVITGRPCREVVFSDGSSIVADVHHQWEVLTRAHHGGRRRQILSTGQIERSLKYSRTEYAHHVAQAAPVEYPAKALPIDPYVFGAWIGDGTSTKAELTCADEPILREIALAGYAVAPASGPIQYRIGGEGHTRDERTGRYSRNGSLSSRLRDLEARQKHIGKFRTGRAIVAVDPVDSVPVRCIQVASGRGVYLVGRAFIPTHNSSLGRLGLIVHATAGFIDPGWKGTLTLELNNLTRVPIKLYPGLLIAQLSFMGLDKPAERPYGSAELGSHYQGQVAATESRYMR